MFQAWRGGDFEHQGKFWNLKLPMLRPQPYTKPHPYVIRIAVLEWGELGYPVPHAPQNVEQIVTQHRQSACPEWETIEPDSSFLSPINTSLQIV